MDSVTLHNQALLNMGEKPSVGFEKLQFLLQQTPCPPGLCTLPFYLLSHSQLLLINRDICQSPAPVQQV